METKNKRLSFRVTEEEAELIKKLAAKENRSISDYVRLTLLEVINTKKEGN